MKINRTLFQNLVVLITFLLMLLIIWGVSNGYLLSQDEIDKAMIESAIDK